MTITNRIGTALSRMGFIKIGLLFTVTPAEPPDLEMPTIAAILSTTTRAEVQDATATTANIASTTTRAVV